MSRSSSTRSSTPTSWPARAPSAWRSSSSARTCARSRSRSAAAAWPRASPSRPRRASPAVRVIGVQAEAVAPFPASLAAGHPVTVAPGPTMADGIAVARPGELAFAVLAELADRMVTVSEESLSRALLLCLERSKQVVEPAGAAGVAALLEHPRAFEPPVVAVLSGGNIDPLLLAKVLRHGLAAAGRYLTFRCRAARPSRRAGHAAGRGGRARRQRARRGARAGHAGAARGRGRGAAAGGDQGPGALRQRDRAGCASPATSCCSADPRDQRREPPAGLPPGCVYAAGSDLVP